MGNPGKQFENDWSNSCKKQKVYFDRIKDTFIPPELRTKIRVSKNKFDYYLFKNGWLFPCELKSCGQKSISFDEKIIKQHQIDSLLEATTFEDQIIPGFVFNYREHKNQTFFVHILDFIEYKNSTSKKSISLDVCYQIGIIIDNEVKKVHYQYDILKFINDGIEKYKDKLGDKLNESVSSCR